MKLSTTIITLNEEENIERTIKSATTISDEIVVVDSDSEDKTVAKAKNLGAKVYSRKFDNYSSQKNYAAKKARGKWILSLDADEVVSTDLANEIKEKVIINKPEFDAFSIPRKNYILGKFIKYTRWQPELDRQVWLWKKSKGKWVGDVHEEIKVSGSIGKLKGAKIHYQYKTVREFLQMMNHYSEIEANYRLQRGVGFSFFRLFFDPLYNFLVRYFYRLGFLDGWRGFVLSYLMALYHLEVWVKIWERKR